MQKDTNKIFIDDTLFTEKVSGTLWSEEHFQDNCKWQWKTYETSQTILKEITLLLFGFFVTFIKQT